MVKQLRVIHLIQKGVQKYHKNFQNKTEKWINAVKYNRSSIKLTPRDVEFRCLKNSYFKSIYSQPSWMMKQVRSNNASKASLERKKTYKLVNLRRISYKV